jgi:hypothetical protein
VLAGREGGSDAAFIAAMQQMESEAQLAQWKGWSDASSVLEMEEQAVLMDLLGLENAFSTSGASKRS